MRINKTSLGDIIEHKSGMKGEVVGYRKDADIDVLFSNGTQKTCRYYDVVNGRVSTVPPLKLIEEGGTYNTTNYGDVTVVGKDINKEEGDVLEESNLSMKDVGKYVSTKAREFYIDKLNRDLL